MELGTTVGSDEVGSLVVGLPVGDADGEQLGISLGDMEGQMDGPQLGEIDGLSLGMIVGPTGCEVGD